MTRWLPHNTLRSRRAHPPYAPTQRDTVDQDREDQEAGLIHRLERRREEEDLARAVAHGDSGAPGPVDRVAQGRAAQDLAAHAGGKADLAGYVEVRSPGEEDEGLGEGAVQEQGIDGRIKMCGCSMLRKFFTHKAEKKSRCISGTLERKIKKKDYTLSR
ncbi:hypothetical protein RB195_001207 [Necator americanus]|uniref:Uncharacterized protein n=1 Tax=Necator americanus TaxID=51031 RepID=A0ABR1DES4_NECAM